MNDTTPDAWISFPLNTFATNEGTAAARAIMAVLDERLGDLPYRFTVRPPTPGGLGGAWWLFWLDDAVKSSCYNSTTGAVVLAGDDFASEEVAAARRRDHAYRDGDFMVERPRRAALEPLHRRRCIVSNPNLTLAALHPHVHTTTPASVVRGIVDALNLLHGDKWTKVTVRPPSGTATLWQFWTDDGNVSLFDASTGKAHHSNVNHGGLPTHFFAPVPADFTIEPVRNGGGVQ